MSMSQEEIESLMNGLELDVKDEKDEKKEDNKVKETALSSHTQQASKNSGNPEDENIKNNLSNKKTDDTLTNTENIKSEDNVSNNTIDELLEDLQKDNNISPENQGNKKDEENFDDILAGIDGITDNDNNIEENSKEEPLKKDDKTDKKNELENKIDNGIFPLPAEKDTKVVNQLSQVANDSEEKASKIFDVLSYVLDSNNEIQKGIKNIDETMVKHLSFINCLHEKFPNIKLFEEHVNKISNIKKEISQINKNIDAGNMKIFEGMELMQFHDINRQKIERVMAVIRKLSFYLNNLFEDDNPNNDKISVAKHIHGDSTPDVLNDDDLDSLIEEFGTIK